MSGGLDVSGLGVRFGDRTGLADLSFEVAPGERFVVLGPSGSGKTSLLRTLAGLIPAAGGRITIARRDVTNVPCERRDSVYLHQTPLLFPHLTVSENVAFALRIRRRPDAAIQTMVDRLLESVRLAEFGARRPHVLSGGQRHRVALARAMAAGHAVLLLDEPLASLDPGLRDDIRETLRNLQAQASAPPAIVLVTHDLDEAAALGHRIGVLVGGRLAQVDAPANLFRAPASLAVARFLGIPNLVPGRIIDGWLDSELGAFRPARAPTAGAVVAVFGLGAVQPDEAGIEGRVVAVHHGPHQVRVTAMAGATRLQYAHPPGAVPSVGDRVRLGIDHEQVLLFPADTDV